MVDDQETRVSPETQPLEYRRGEGRGKKWPLLVAKIVVMAVVLGFVGYQVWQARNKLANAQFPIDWRWGILAAASFCGSMLTSGMVWYWLARRMKDRGPLVPLLGAYTFSQMGKYVPGKVALLLMRIERTGRFGMSAQTCTLSTLLENALYMVSGGLVGMLAIVKIVEGVKAEFRGLIWPATIGGVGLLLLACYPPIFYALVNRLLRGMKKPAIGPEERLGMLTLAGAIVGFVPCWFFGGLALWASTQAVHGVPLGECWWFAGAYALSVIIGMGSFLPGGLGIREAVLLAAVTLQLSPGMGPEKALLAAGIVAVLQRVFQLAAEMVLGIAGGAMTSARSPGTNPPTAS